MVTNQISDIEKEIINFLMDWKYYLKRLDELRESLAECTTNTTIALQESKTSGGGSISSTVERCVIRRMKLEKEAKDILDALELYITAINHAGLVQTEYDIIKCIMDRKELLQYAREKNIYRSNVYKIKDRAVRKIAEYILNDKNAICIYNRVKC